MPLLVLMMLSWTVAQQVLQVVLNDDQLMMQVENSFPKMMKSMSRVEEDVGKIKSPNNSMNFFLTYVKYVSASEWMSGASQFISLRILGQGSIGVEVSGVNVEESWLEAGVETDHQVMWKNYKECWLQREPKQRMSNKKSSFYQD